MGRASYRQQLWEVALDQYGYVTTADADALDIPAVGLRKLAQRGFLTRVSRGLYRFDALPTTPLDHYMEAVLWAGADAVLSHDAVLALHDLAFANPRRLRVTTPNRVRKSQPRPDVEIITAEIPAADRTRYEGIPSTTVARALIDSRHHIMPSRLREAADDARARGLLLTDEHERVLAALDAAVPSRTVR